MVALFLGEPVDYWAELKAQVDEHGDEALTPHRLIGELAEVRAKVGFYEKRVLEMEKFRKHYRLKEV